MPLVTAANLAAYMGNPTWSQDQREEAGRICERLEARLADRLNTPLSPGPPRVETVAVLATGLVATSYPVFSVSSINGTDIPIDDPLPDGWFLQDNRLRTTAATIPGSLTLSSLMPSMGVFGRVDGVDAVSVTYLPGWGPKPTLIEAILEKARAQMTNRHDDTVVIRDLDATPPPPLDEDWTDDEINNGLGIYRNLLAFR